MNPNRGRDIAAVVLACGLVFAVCALTVGVVYDAIASAGPGLSDNATQVLVAAFGGIIGILGTYIGYQAAATGGAGGGLFRSAPRSAPPAPTRPPGRPPAGPPTPPTSAAGSGDPAPSDPSP